MPLSDKAVKHILGIHGEIPVTAENMAKTLSVTFFPSQGHVYSTFVKKFSERLEKSLIRLGVHIIPYEKALVEPSFLFLEKRYVKAVFNNIVFLLRKLLRMPEVRPYISFSVLRKIRRGRKIKRGIAVIALGEGKSGNLPMDNVTSFSDGNIVTIVDIPGNINETTGFETHFDTALKLFAYHVTNIIIGVGKVKWILYNFNASHPIYPISDPLEKHLLQSLIPKLAAPIRPPRLSEFTILPHTFDITDEKHQHYIDDLIDGGKILNNTNLYPPGRKIDELPFRNDLYRWMGQVHLDDRNGMSYGFLARQLPIPLPTVQTIDKIKNYLSEQDRLKDYFESEGNFYLIFNIKGTKIAVKVPDVWVLTLRSGSNKTNPHPIKDVVKMGLCNGKMFLQTPKGLRIDRYYKPTFDTKVILAHAVGNAIFGAISKYFNPNSHFARQMEQDGIAIAHWHGYINPKHIPTGWYVHGEKNPTVSCSSPQSAIYAFRGKEEVFMKSIVANLPYHGDIHIEPQHGTNISYNSLKDLAELLRSNPEMSEIGNKYLPLYQNVAS